MLMFNYTLFHVLQGQLNPKCPAPLIMIFTAVFILDYQVSLECRFVSSVTSIT